jgi:uncharacterized hydrophobic protein (TIGR00271 family)
MSITRDDFKRMRSELLFEEPESRRKLSRFWVLLVLAGVIASAGIVSDSTATVIGAMIVAPLMTPIMGTVFAIVSGDGKNIIVSLTLVAAGAVAVIAIGWLFGLLAPIDVVADTNSQVAARVHPRLIDLVAALATGVVGAFALSRPDVSDTLPGVAIAISLVPPLAVAGLTLEAGATREAQGAMLLFLTNVGAILFSGLVVMTLFRVYEQVRPAGGRGLAWGYRGAQVLVVVFVVMLVVPLGAATVQITSERTQAADVDRVAEEWAEAAGWRVVDVDLEPGHVAVTAVGPLPEPPSADLRQMLDESGLADVDVELTLVPTVQVDLPAN